MDYLHSTHHHYRPHQSLPPFLQSAMHSLTHIPLFGHEEEWQFLLHVFPRGFSQPFDWSCLATCCCCCLAGRSSARRARRRSPRATRGSRASATAIKRGMMATEIFMVWFWFDKGWRFVGFQVVENERQFPLGTVRARQQLSHFGTIHFEIIASLLVECRENA